jgi:hypothetical protein
MAEPLRIIRSLDDITTRYTVFEKDQVLTHDQLNDLAGYLDDQDRLTRVGLLGVGIVAGLRVSLSDAGVAVTRGVGVTTDGDLLRLPADALFARFKPYDKSAPAYAPFYVDQDVTKDMLPVFELVAEETATPLAQLPTGMKLSDMAVVFLMESYVRDEDMCTATACDNLGQGSIHTPRLLLLRKSDLKALQGSLPTLDQAVRALPEVTVDRPQIAANFAPAVYRAVCDTAHKALVAALKALYPACASLLADLFAADPGGDWAARLETVRGGFANRDSGIQYYYDFLKDLAETYNAFRELLAGDTTVCCPGVDAFPKHLLLGGLDGGTDLRTGFYPSPLTSRTTAAQAHARFLAGKLDALIRTFKLPPAGTIRVTPSRGEGHSLEERAIPFYYEGNDAAPVHRAWNYALTQRGLEKSNYSYNADRWQGPSQPFNTQVGRFDFFRVEGHVGLRATDAVEALKKEIQNHNLPFQVRAVTLSKDRTKILIKPPIRYTDLHRFHYLLRQDLVAQLDDATRFSKSFKGQVDDAVARNVVTDQSEDTDGASVRTTAEQKNNAVTAGSAAASGKLNRGYLDYVADPSWQTDMTNTLNAAGEFKANLGKVVKTDFSTPFDSLIASNHTLWLGWLDNMIKTKNDQADDKLLFGNFLQRHPGVEHFAGVTRGGTFVLAHDEGGIVVADFMLPYILSEPDEEAPPEPPLPKLPVKTQLVLEQGAKVTASRERFVADKLTGLRSDIGQIQSSYVDAFKDSIKLVGNVLTPVPRAEVGPKVADPLLDVHLKEMDIQRQKVDLLRAETLKPNTDPDRQKALDTQLRDAEVALANAASDTTQFLTTSKADVKEGSDGFKALQVVSDSVSRLNNKDALTQVQKGLAAASGRAATPELKGSIAAVLKNRGLGG